MEQNKFKRAGTGLRGCDRDRACPGYTLFTPIAGKGTTFLIDLDGEVFHKWDLPYPPGQYGYLTPKGHLFYNGKVLEGLDRFQGWELWKAGAALELDWAGRTRWEVRHPDHHHDGMRLRNGNLILLCCTTVPNELVSKVRGGIPGTEKDGKMWADYIVEITAAGEVVWTWRSWEHLDPEEDRITPQDRRDEWTHGNTVVETHDGNLLVSFRHVSTVVLVERRSGNIIWKLGPPLLAQQHAPTPLPNGNLLIFDNGVHRQDSPAPYSRVIEVNPLTKEIVWSYEEPRRVDFFSPYISNAQRLPNGNTLICEGSFGRIFEVTTNGTVVWEYVNPFFDRAHGLSGQPVHNEVFRAFRYSEEEIAMAREAL